MTCSASNLVANICPKSLELQDVPISDNLAVLGSNESVIFHLLTPGAKEVLRAVVVAQQQNTHLMIERSWV